MTRKGDTVLIAALKRYGKKIEKYIQKSLHNNMKVKVLVEDARDSQGKASGAAYLEIEIDKKKEPKNSKKQNEIQRKPK